MDDPYCPRCTKMGDPRFWRGEKSCRKCAHMDEGRTLKPASPAPKMDSKERSARVAAIDTAHYRVAYDNILESYFRAALLTLRAHGGPFIHRDPTHHAPPTLAAYVAHLEALLNG